MPKDTIHQRLKQIIGKERGDKASLARTLGIRPQQLNQWLSGYSKPPLEMIPRIIEATGTTYTWFLNGKGAKHPQMELPQIKVGLIGEDAGADTLAIPCPAVANAGEAIFPEEYLDRLSEKHYLFRKRFLDKINAHADWICILIDEREGDSMSPTLTPGDLILVDRNLKPYLRSVKTLMKLNGTLALLADPDSSGLFVKRIWIDPEGRLTAHSDNHAFAPKNFDLEDQNIQQIIVGRVVWRGHKL